MRLFVLNEVRIPVIASSFDEWCQWLHDNKSNMSVASTELEDGTRVLTCFLGHSTYFSDDNNNPYTFSTRVLGGQFHDREKYYTSWESAEKGHEEMVLKIIEEIDPEWPMELPLAEDTKVTLV